MGIDLEKPYRQLRDHIGHDIVCVAYRRGLGAYGLPLGPPQNVAIECETCGTVLIDADADVETASILEHLPDPDVIGQSEYRAIHDCLVEAEAHDVALATAILDQFVEHAVALKVKLVAAHNSG